MLIIANMEQTDVIFKRHTLRKISLQWPDKLCNEILWMVLGEERPDPARRGKGVH